MRKLNMNKVNEIRHRVNVLGQTRANVSRTLKVSRSTVSSVANYNSYQDIPAPRTVPGFNNYLVYPNGKVWSTTTNKFLKTARKSEGSKARYVHLKNRNNRRSIRVEQLVNSLF